MIKKFNEYKEPFDKEETKKFFIDKIDWNLVNKIQYHLTKYEDNNGSECKIKILLHHIDKPSKLGVICTILNDYPHYVSDYTSLIEAYNANSKILYVVDIDSLTYNDPLYDKLMNDIVMNVKGYIYDGYYITKNNI